MFVATSLTFLIKSESDLTISNGFFLPPQLLLTILLLPNLTLLLLLPDDLWHTSTGRLKVYSYLLDQMEAPH